jgi:hypothetical protein
LTARLGRDASSERVAAIPAPSRLRIPRFGQAFGQLLITIARMMNIKITSPRISVAPHELRGVDDELRGVDLGGREMADLGRTCR